MSYFSSISSNRSDASVAFMMNRDSIHLNICFDRFSVNLSKKKRKIYILDVITYVYTKVITMDPEKVKSVPKEHMRTVHLTVRITPHIKYWLKKNHFSATKIFHEAIKELGYKRE